MNEQHPHPQNNKDRRDRPWVSPKHAGYEVRKNENCCICDEGHGFSGGRDPSRDREARNEDQDDRDPELRRDPPRLSGEIGMGVCKDVRAHVDLVEQRAADRTSDEDDEEKWWEPAADSSCASRQRRGSSGSTPELKAKASCRSPSLGRVDVCVSAARTRPRRSTR